MIAWIHQYRPRSAWYLLPDDEQAHLLAEWEACSRRAIEAGAERIGEFSVRGQSVFERLVLWTFPTAAAAEALWNDLVAHGYSDQRETANLLGVDSRAAEGGHAA